VQEIVEKQGREALGERVLGLGSWLDLWQWFRGLRYTSGLRCRGAVRIL
jgi:hypothetical protein